ncbi:MAG TPA: hypothetical protein VFA05_00025 [Gaiellaceae bacterium]|nr:hypothetical protein [Gaiellaceae bacterium]
MTRSGQALRLALRDFYGNSWRLVPLNALLGAALVAVGVATFAVHALLVLAVLAGPLAAALAHCAVTLVRTGNLTLADALDGVRLHWRRGLQLAAAGTAFAVLVALAVPFYATSPLGLPLMFLAIYVAVLLGVYQLVLWTLAVADPQRSLRQLVPAAAETLVRRPGATAALTLVLLVVNLAGIAAAVMPFLTLTVAYSFVAIAHFALPRELEEESC